MAKAPISKIALEAFLLAEIRSRAGCEGVFAVEIEPVHDLRSETNWRVGRVGSGAVDPVLAKHAGDTAMTELREQYVLRDT